MAVNSTIPTADLVTFAKGHFKSESSSVCNTLGLLQNNKIDWLTAQSLLDINRRNVLAVSGMTQVLLAGHPADYQEVDTGFKTVMQQIETTSETMTSNYLLNGPKAVQS